MKTPLLITEIKDSLLRKNFETLARVFASLPILDSQFQFFEIAIASAQAHFRYPHGLSFVPKDVVQTNLIGTGTLTWNPALFDTTYLDLTTSGPCTVRAFIGTYQKGVSV